MKTLHMSIVAAALAVAPMALAQEATPPPTERGSDRVPSDELERARAALAEAARRVAELSAHETDRIMRHFEFGRAPGVRLGVMVGEAGADGVTVVSVTEDMPAARAGLQQGDVLLEIGGVSLAGATDGTSPAVGRVHRALADRSPGDEVKVRYRRGRQTREATVTLEAAPQARAFAFMGGPERPLAPMVDGLMMRRALGSYQLVSVSRELGQYFNTDRGLLVVHVGDDNPLGLRDGDVILSIDGREPASPTHAARILRSYTPGETAKVEIMRQRRRQTLEITVPPPQRTATMQRDAAPGLPLRTAD